MAGAYLDGKPLPSGKKKLTKERDSLFWVQRGCKGCPPDAWVGEAMSLALARYLGQEPVAADGLVARVAREAPADSRRQARWARLEPAISTTSRTGSGLRPESEAVAELCRVLDLFASAHRERIVALEAHKSNWRELSVFDLLLYASLYAFEVLVVPRDFKVKAPAPPSGANVPVAWDALSDLLAWKLAEASTSSLKLTDDSIGRSIARHLRPVLFESGTASAGEALRNLRAFHALMDAQIELNEFISRSADAFSYDEGIRFERRGDRLEIVEVDPAARAAWQRDGLKLDRLHGYWFHRAVDTYVEQVAADRATWMIGRPRTRRPTDWPGCGLCKRSFDCVRRTASPTKSRPIPETVDLFRALLSLKPDVGLLPAGLPGCLCGAPRCVGGLGRALQRLTMDGLREGLQNRMPLTWSSRDSKVSNITGWTVTASEPAGNPRMASAILDFWTYDMVSRRQSGSSAMSRVFSPTCSSGRSSSSGRRWCSCRGSSACRTTARPRSTNLRRLGARRGQARDEARRIEAGSPGCSKRGFRTLLNWVPPRGTDDAGEVDLIAVLDGHLFVIEVKSTFMRRSQRDAWLHATTTLRKAGQQLRRKVEAVSLPSPRILGFARCWAWPRA